MKKDKNTLVRKIYRKKTIERLEKEIDLLGIENKYSCVYFLNIRLIISFLISIFVFFFFDFGYLFGPLIFIIIYYFSYYFLIKFRIKLRTKELESEALIFFEVLTLSLETGKNLEQTLKITCNNVDSKLSREFKIAINQINFGKSLNEILANLNKYIPSEAINNMILSISQSNIMGSNIITSLRSQIEYLREKKIMETKAEISKIPTKISIISVIFFIPLILFIVLGPALINYLEYLIS